MGLNTYIFSSYEIKKKHGILQILNSFLFFVELQHSEEESLLPYFVTFIKARGHFNDIDLAKLSFNFIVAFKKAGWFSKPIQSDLGDRRSAESVGDHVIVSSFLSVSALLGVSKTNFFFATFDGGAMSIWPKGP